jgi:hypothetical protein
MPWRTFSVEQVADLVNQVVSDQDLEALLLAGVWNQAAGRAKQAEDSFLKASILDAKAARDAQDSIRAR